MRSLLRPKENERDDKMTTVPAIKEETKTKSLLQIGSQPSARLCNLFTLQGGFAIRDRVGDRFIKQNNRQTVCLMTVTGPKSDGVLSCVLSLLQRKGGCLLAPSHMSVSALISIRALGGGVTSTLSHERVVADRIA